MTAMLHALFIAPFADFEFMRRALVACLALALGSGPMGVFLILRRMSLVGDALSHAIMPGAAVGFLLAGLSLPAMSLGGFVAGLLVALLSGVVARVSKQREDASFAAFYLISLAAGVLIVSTRGSNVDLMHVLFGSILAVDNASLLLVAGISSFTLLAFALVYRLLVVECFDPGFLRAVGGGGSGIHMLFLVLVVLNLVAGFQALGTLMAVGLMMLPAIASRFWVREVWSLALLSIAFAFLSGYAGLVISFQHNLPSGPAIVLFAGVLYVASFVFGRHGGLIATLWPGRHRRR
ncbi:manganese transport system membrane protein MntB [mine drainage metagenome]|uniref:Manganese transport system membrane protein MntB n=1 Tax=mine drainage metagenome TaxID=410659 RepID=A0A1J5RN39_9ZZZZ